VYGSLCASDTRSLDFNILCDSPGRSNFWL